MKCIENLALSYRFPTMKSKFLSSVVCKYVVLAYVVHKDEIASFLVGGSCNPCKLHVRSTRLRKYVTIIGLVIIGVTRANMELGACYEDASNPFNNLHSRNMES